MSKQNRQSDQQRAVARARSGQRRALTRRRFGSRRQRKASFPDRIVAAFRAQGHGTDPREAFDRACRFYLRGSARAVGPQGEPGSPDPFGDGFSRLVVVLGVGLVGVAYTVNLAQFAGVA